MNVAGLGSIKLLGQQKHVLLLPRFCHLGYFSNTCFSTLVTWSPRPLLTSFGAGSWHRLTTGGREKAGPAQNDTYTLTHTHQQTKTCGGEVCLTVEFVTFPEWPTTQTPKLPQGDLAELLTLISLWYLRYVQDALCLCSSRIVRALGEMCPPVTLWLRVPPSPLSWGT